MNDFSKITIGVTAYLRPDSLARFLQSCERWYPGVRVDVIDTGGNLSAGRNRLVERCQTPYLLICEDDFEFCNAETLANLQAVLDHDSKVDLIGGRLKHLGKWTEYNGEFRKLGLDILQICNPLRSSWHETASGVFYRQTDLNWNFFLARREFLATHTWCEELPLCEHTAFFYACQQQGAGIYYTPCARVIHHHDRPSEEYNTQRARATNYTSVLKQRFGYDKVIHKTREVVNTGKFLEYNRRCMARQTAIDFAIHFPECVPFCGTLLGMERDGDLIPWDTDIDFAVIAEQPQYSLDAFRRVGPFRRVKTFHHNGVESEWAFKHSNGIKVDLFRLMPKGDDGTRELAAWPDECPDVPTVTRTFAPGVADGVSERVVWGHRFRFPRDVHACLEACYGDWRTPNPDYDPHAPLEVVHG